MSKRKSSRSRSPKASQPLLASLRLVDAPHVVWGVDSARTANSTAVGGATTFDYVAQRAGVAPAFWGRYIGGKYAMTSPEVAYLHAKGAKVLVVYNGATDSPKSVLGGTVEGQKDAGSAAAAATALHIPPGVAIYSDIEGSWAVTPDWLRGWVTTLIEKNYAPGFYGDCTSVAPFARAYCAALKVDPALAASHLWNMEPELNPQCRAGPAAPAYAPSIPPCGGNVVLWQYTEGCWEDKLGLDAGIDMDLATEAALAVMW